MQGAKCYLSARLACCRDLLLRLEDAGCALGMRAGSQAVRLA